MSLSRTQIIFASLFVILVIAGLVVGLILTRRSQTTRSEAAGEETPFATVPPFESGTAGGLPKVPPSPLKGDCNGDGQVTETDESCFMQHYLAKDSAADMDNSGQVNSLDLTMFRNLISQ